VGGEPNQIVKPDAELRLALAFADVYQVGMSHHGLRILYEIANRLEGVAAERVFAPFPDMERELRAAGRRLATLETSTPLSACQVLGFSLGYELAASSVLTILDLGGVPLTRFERENSAAPLVIAGGAACLNPEPLSDFIDVFVIGEGEEALPELLAIVRRHLPLAGERRRAILREIAGRVEGAYVPEFYQTAAGPGGETVVTGGLAADIPFPIRRRVAANFDSQPQSVRPVVPIHETVHERAVLEIMRGCPNGCRFCQAGYAGRPLRERSPETLVAAARDCLAATGYDEVGLLSLSSSNYSRFDSLVETLDRELAPRGVSLSLPSLRVDHALSGIPARFASVRKSGLTVAPEAGSDRLRAVINKEVKNSDLLIAAAEAFRRNWRQIKLYFMIGLPTETDEDVLAIADLALAAARQRQSAKGRGGKPAIQVSVSNFVPKPFTPFQWLGAAGIEAWEAKQRLLAERMNRRLVAWRGHDAALSRLEAVFARGDRRLGAVILAAWRAGARLDAWSEHFRPGVWLDAFAARHLDPAALAAREFDPAGALPWDHIDCGTRKDFLLRELGRARSATPTAACSPGVCAGCGVPGCGFAAAAV
ncbi:MAG: TIGR03960 family B12-binding radical SAM protein, partial [Planctomycetota bacterium]|nr:TIGR03960 family B12-binding radical SAM protein [Planctomycetota bacterium]